jgi:hypothetical protein
VNPKERIAVCKKLFEIFKQTKTETAVMPPPKFIKHSFSISLFIIYLINRCCIPSYTMKLTGNINI